MCQAPVTNVFLPSIKGAEHVGSSSSGACVDHDHDHAPPPHGHEATSSRRKADVFRRTLTRLLSTTSCDGDDNKPNKLVVFAARNESLNAVKRVLETTVHNDAACWRVVGLVGQLSKRKERVLHEFRNNAEIRVLLILQSDGAQGPDLSVANHVLIYDLTENTSQFLQMISRADREGQTRQTYVHNFIVPGMPEEYLLQLAAQNKQIKASNDLLPMISLYENSRQMTRPQLRLALLCMLDPNQSSKMQKMAQTRLRAKDPRRQSCKSRRNNSPCRLRSQTSTYQVVGKHSVVRSNHRPGVQ
jgi:hypothetical protein